MHKRRFVIRTIKNGQVKIYGRMYKPTNKWLEYDGRLDGQRWAFGLYWTGDKQLPFVALWGTEEAYVAAHDYERWEAHCAIGALSPDAVHNEEDGVWYYPWAAWHIGPGYELYVRVENGDLEPITWPRL